MIRTSGRRASSPRDRTRLAHRAPRRRFEPAAQPGTGRREPDRHHDDDEEHRVHVARLVPAPDHRLLDDAERDGCRRDRGQALHASDDRRGQRGQQERRAEHGAERQPDDAGAEEHGEERQERGDGPHHGVHPPHRDPDERGAVDVVGAGAHRQAEAGAEEDARCPRNASGMTISATTSLPPKRRGSTVNDTSIGAGKLCGGRSTPNHPGRRSPIPASTCARPIVATESTRRGARKKRRITSTSTSTPSTTAVASPAANATSQLAPLVTTSSTASEAGAAPRSPWAKLRIRCARYTSARPEREERAQSAEQRALHDDARRWSPQHLHDDEERHRGRDPDERRAGAGEVAARRTPR